MIDCVLVSKLAQKQLERCPLQIVRKLAVWTDTVRKTGLELTRRIPGYHDEPLRGQRYNQRSIRLNRSYRAIYEIKKSDIEFIEIQEVTKHDY